ncbi:MAG: putative Ig domain-containing protein [Bryobacteraceae bacterium]
MMRFSIWIAVSLCAASQAAVEPPLLTPKPGPAPRINAPQVYGARPQRPFLYRIPCTGKRPIAFAAEGLPAGLKLDRASGIISGRPPAKPGRYTVVLRARNASGSARRAFTLVIGDRLALTPPMGWNHWYTHYNRITDKLMRQAADVMIESGMADFGYEYVNIDDCWMVMPGSSDPELGGEPRTPAGGIRPNARFPDMAGLAAYIHSKGLKAGLYTSPGPLTCAKFEGSYGHEEADAKQFAAWGFDFLKYDWCSYTKVAGGKELEHLMKPYALMGGILPKLERDIVLNLCQYGMGDVWNWGGEVGGHSWRTTGDLGLAKDTRLPGFYSIAFLNAQHAANAGPGRWNDPDYILIGTFGKARGMGQPQKTTLTADEQYSYMSLWAMMASPLFFSGDMGKLDEFTLNVLCNAEVIEVDQDPLGRQANIVRRTEDEYVLARPLSDGSMAVGLFNLGEESRRMSIEWSALGISGPRRVRDLWRQRDMGSANGRFEADVARHGVFLFRLRPPAARPRTRSAPVIS